MNVILHFCQFDQTLPCVFMVLEKEYSSYKALSNNFAYKKIAIYSQNQEV